MTKKYGWTKDVLINHIENSTYENYKPIGVATYQMRDTLPEQMKNLLPSPEEIKKRLEGLK